MSGVLCQMSLRTIHANQSVCRCGKYSGLRFLSLQLPSRHLRTVILNGGLINKYVLNSVTQHYAIPQRCMASYARKKKQIEFVFEDREDTEKLFKKYSLLRPKKSPLAKQIYVLDRELARTLVDKMWPNGSLAHEKSFILDCCPGPGILTEELLKSGAPRVVALENQEYFLPFIGKLSQQYPNRLQCVYADVNRLDPVGDGDVFPPARTSIDLFQIIGAKPTEWESDPVVKVIHMVANKYNERALLLRNIFNLVNRFSWFQYGRIENYFLISHKDYKAITHTPKQKYRSQYLPLAVLHDMACHVELLHTEPRTSFHPFPKMSMDPPTQPSQIPDVHLIKVTPRRDFFSYNLCRTDYGLLCFMVKQFMSKKSTHLMTAVENWAPGCGHVVTSLGLDSKTLTGDITGKQYFQLFLEICKNNGFDGSWLKEEALDFVDGGLLLSDHPSSSRSRYRYAF